jgi:hypothetical protein
VCEAHCRRATDAAGRADPDNFAVKAPGHPKSTSSLAIHVQIRK